MSPEVLLAGVMVAALVLYALFGGADYGGGVWDLLASGPRKQAQRALVARTLGPIWEANHVWLIVAVVLLFSGFPRAFAAVSVALHIPLTLLLVGIVARGSAFTFRTYARPTEPMQQRWGLVFSLSSVLTPLFLGTVVGALAGGRIRLEGGQVVGGFLEGWWSPFPLAVGLFALVLFAFLAAVYLTCETDEPLLRADFRRRALSAGLAVGGLALAVALLARSEAPRVFAGLTARPWALALHLATAVAAVVALGGLWRQRFGLARVAAAVQVALIVVGWAVSQYPYLVVPDLTLAQAAASPGTLRLLLGCSLAGLVLIVPCLVLLYRVFHSRAPPGL